MKPPEILAMVEETAGTKMYESSKNNSLKLIEKKEKKVAEIEEVKLTVHISSLPGRLGVRIHNILYNRFWTTRLARKCGSSTKSGPPT